jgi:1-aminocyclopropane-1-carboxylate deaminase
MLNNDNLETLKRFPTVALGNWPTPVERVALPGRPAILVKRDDLSGYGRGGAKTRKIESALGYMIDQGYDQLITVSGNVTNLVFDIVPALKHLSLASDLFIIDDPPVQSADRDAIFAGMHQDIHLVGSCRMRLLAHMLRAAIRGRRQGHRPMLVPAGIAHPAGIIGNALGFIEMVEQLEAAGEALPHTVFVTAATGSTAAGFLLAEHALRLSGRPPIRVVGSQIYPGHIAWWTLGLIRWTERFLRLPKRVPRKRVDIRTDALHRGFARFPAELAELCERVHDQTDFRIDPIFGGKTWSVMEQAMATEQTRRPTLYWHCGYTPEWKLLGNHVARGEAA